MNDRTRTSRAATALPLATMLALFAACSSTGNDPGEPNPAVAGERVGTYDGRAVVIAYANGPRFDAWARARKQAHDAAEAAGDAAAAAAIESEMQTRQARFHAQAFEGDDIDDVLAVVSAELPAILADADVTRLEKVNRDRAEGVVTVDVTDRLVALFEPSEKGLQWIADMRSKPFPK